MQDCDLTGSSVCTWKELPGKVVDCSSLEVYGQRAGWLAWRTLKSQEATWPVGEGQLGAPCTAERKGRSRQDWPQQTLAAEPGKAGWGRTLAIPTFRFITWE